MIVPEETYLRGRYNIEQGHEMADMRKHIGSCHANAEASVKRVKRVLAEERHRLHMRREAAKSGKRKFHNAITKLKKIALIGAASFVDEGNVDEWVTGNNQVVGGQQFCLLDEASVAGPITGEAAEKIFLREQGRWKAASDDRIAIIASQHFTVVQRHGIGRMRVTKVNIESALRRHHLRDSVRRGRLGLEDEEVLE